MNDALFSVSFDTLKVNSITNPEIALGQLYFLPPLNGGVVPTEPRAEDIDRLFEQAGTTANDPDFDLDGNVDFGDFLAFRSRFEESLPFGS